MATDFKWRTEEEHGWEEEAVDHDARNRGQRRRPRWLLYLALLALVIVAGVVVARRVSARVEEATSQVAGDVLSSHDVVLRAVATRDGELFTTILSGRDDAWTDRQRKLVDAGVIFDRPLLNFHAAAVQPITDENVTLSDDLQAAEVTIPVAYTIDVGNDVRQPVTLLQTHLYRRGNNQRWLFAPPLDAFWGAAETAAATRLSATFPARDGELARRLIVDLDRMLAETCQLPEVTCPAAARLEVQFSTDPQSLLDGQEPETWFDQVPTTTLPTPTLVGVPADSAAYSALLRGYGARLARTMLSVAAGGACCRQPLLFQATVDRQLADLGLQPWPMGRNEYQQLLRSGALAAPVISYLSAPFDPGRQEEAWPVTYAMLEYLLHHRADLTAGALQRTPVTPEMVEKIDLDDRRSWFLFLSDRLAELEPPPGPAPVDTPPVALLCTNNGQVERYTATPGQRPEVAIALDRDAYLFPLSGAGRYLVVDQKQGAAVYGEDGVPQTIRGADVVGQRPLYPLETRRPDRLTLIYGGDGNSRAVNVPLDQCAAGACPSEPLPGVPYWSPSGENVITLPLGAPEAPLLMDDEGVVLRHIDARTRTVAWLDDTTFAFGVEDTVFRSGVRWDNSQPLYDVRESVSNNNNGGFRHVGVTHLVAGQDALFFSATFRWRNGVLSSTLFRYQLSNGKVDELQRVSGRYIDLLLAPDGARLLAISTLDRRAGGPAGSIPTYEYTLWNAKTLDSQSWLSDRSAIVDFPYWSPDGAWLIIPGQELHRVNHLPSGAMYVVGTNPGAICYQAEWP